MYFGILVPQPKKNKKYVNSQREHKFMLFPRRKDKEQKKKNSCAGNDDDRLVERKPANRNLRKY